MVLQAIEDEGGADPKNTKVSASLVLGLLIIENPWLVREGMGVLSSTRSATFALSLAADAKMPKVD